MILKSLSKNSVFPYIAVASVGIFKGGSMVVECEKVPGNQTQLWARIVDYYHKTKSQQQFPVF